MLQYFDRLNLLSIKDLYNYYECIRGLGDRARQIYCVWEILYIFPHETEGYVLAGKFYNEAKEFDKALSIFLAGIDAIAPNTVNSEVSIT